MPKYVPILKDKPAELRAWRQASPAVVAGSRPVFEVLARNGLDSTLRRFVNEVAKDWPQGAVLTMDTGYLAQAQAVAGSADNAVLWTARALLGRGVATKPVMRLGDDPVVLVEVAAAAALHGEGACLRLGSPDSDPTADEADRQWPVVCQTTGLRSPNVDLLIDLWEVRTPRDVARAAAVAHRVLQWAHLNGPWRSVTVASGAFPSSISNLALGGATPVHRHDADLFDRIIVGNPPIAPDFGDYAIWHPAVSAPVPRGPLPNLRYTNQREWQVYREGKGTLPGNSSFHVLCGKVVSSSYWPVPGANYSAGDAEIARCARWSGGAGTASQWLQWGASHHLEHVVDRLATLGAP